MGYGLNDHGWYVGGMVWDGLMRRTQNGSDTGIFFLNRVLYNEAVRSRKLVDPICTFYFIIANAFSIATPLNATAVGCDSSSNALPDLLLFCLLILSYLTSLHF